jgi:hypothetical protein
MRAGEHVLFCLCIRKRSAGRERPAFWSCPDTRAGRGSERAVQIAQPLDANWHDQSAGYRTLTV